MIRKALADALKNHAVRSVVSDTKLTKILSQDYEPHFSLKHMFKDVQLAIHVANSREIDLPATTATAGVMYGGLTRGWADEDFSVLARYYQKEPEQIFLNVPSPATPAPQPLAEPPTAAPELPKEPPRESTAAELRDVGIKLPDLPSRRNCSGTRAAEAGGRARNGEARNRTGQRQWPARAGAARTDQALVWQRLAS